MIGLAVMGQNLILNMNDHGFVVCVYNRTTDKVDHFLNNEAKGTKIIGAHSLKDFVSKLKSPRKIMMLVKAGTAVDNLIDSLIPHLSPGDVVIDGGNSEYTDTEKRLARLKELDILYVGTGVSGGEEGARTGPSLMPGGDPEAWPHIKPIFTSICAFVKEEPCCDWVGSGGSGHFVKMVHNGIEYGDMQIICEAYHIMKEALQMGNEEMSQVFNEWNNTELNSFLIEITRDILKFKDTDGSYLLEKIRDVAGQKGTGKWTGIAGLEFGVPLTLIAESVFSRFLSSMIDERDLASKKLSTEPQKRYSGDKTAFVECIKKAVYASKMVSYAQGFMLMREAAKHHGWELNYGAVALMWRGGCIIRSSFLGEIRNAFLAEPSLSNLLISDWFAKEILKCQDGWRQTVAQAALLGIPTPAFSSALAYFDGIRSSRLPANLLQAQRDYFGAHTYELLGAPGKFVHTNWTGRGGNVSASTYQA